MKKVFEFIKKNKYYITMFFTILVICCLAPLNGDDWGNYNPDTSLMWSIGDAIRSYLSYESRIVSRVLINILCYHKIIWNILNSIAFVTIYWSLIKLFNIKDNLGYKLIGIIMLLLPCAMIGQMYTWVTGSITYLFPAALILGYFAYSWKVLKKYSIKNMPILIIINLIGALFIDHCGIALIFINIFLIINYYYKNKKIPIHIIILLLLSICSLLIAFFSPGSSNRLADSSEFANLSFLGKIFSNYDNFLDYIYAANPILALLTLVPINYLITKKIKQNKIVKYIIIMFINIIPIYSLIYHFDIYNPFIEYTSSLDFYWKSETFLTSTFTYVFWTIICILFLISIFYIIKDKKTRIEYYGLLFVGLSPNMAMLLSPTWGFRTTYFTNIMLSALTIGLIINILLKEKYVGKDLKVIVCSVFIILIAYLISIFIIVRHFDIVRFENIQRQFEEGKTEILIKTCPIRYIWNYNPYMEFHAEAYKNYLLDKGIIDNPDIELHFEALDGRRYVIRGW